MVASALPVVAVPGTLCAPAVFDALAAQLGPEFPLDAVDWMTGPGPWSVPDVAGRIADRIVERHDRPVLLLGHSTGGAIALQLAIGRPEFVAGLMPIATGAHMRGHGDVTTIIDGVRDGRLPELAAAVLARSFANPPQPDLANELRAYTARVPQEAVIEVLGSQRDLDLSPHLGALSMPVTVVHGRHDPARPVQRSRELAGAVPDGELVVLETGHTPVHEDADGVAAAVHALAARMR